jgi:hypothetical protein
LVQAAAFHHTFCRGSNSGEAPVYYSGMQQWRQGDGCVSGASLLVWSRSTWAACGISGPVWSWRVNFFVILKFFCLIFGPSI